MNPSETVMLARYVKALCPQQKFDEFTPDAWHDVLGDFALVDARAAAAAVAKRQPFVSPAEIIGEIKRQRGERASDFQGPGLPAEIPDADPDDVQAYLAALRGQRTRAADGVESKPRKMAELLAGVGREIPPEAAAVKRPGPLGTDCTNCGAAIGRPCRTPGGSERVPHVARTGEASDPAVEQAEMERRRAASARHLARQPEDGNPVDEGAAS